MGAKGRARGRGGCSWAYEKKSQGGKSKEKKNMEEGGARETGKKRGGGSEKTSLEGIRLNIKALEKGELRMVVVGREW